MMHINRCINRIDDADDDDDDDDNILISIYSRHMIPRKGIFFFCCHRKGDIRQNVTIAMETTPLFFIFILIPNKIN
jgi:hypothetical protein